MSKKAQSENATETQKSSKPIVSRITEWLLTHIPSNLHSAIKEAAAQIHSEQDGFVRNGNRTDYNRDSLAFSSGAVEMTENGPVLVYSSMKGRRAADVIRAYLLHVAAVIFPEQARTAESGKVIINRRTKDREKWVKSLGFAQAQAGKGQRWLLVLPGSESLITDIEALIPERFEGTEAPKTTKAQVAFNTSVRTLGRTVYIPLYNPERAGVDAVKVDDSLTFVLAALADGWSFKDEESPVASFYLSAVKAKQAPKAPEQTEQVA